MKFVIYVNRKGSWEYHSECQTRTFLAIVLDRLEKRGIQAKYKVDLEYMTVDKEIRVIA